MVATYRSAKVREIFSTVATLHETSGSPCDNLFWTTNDDTDTTIYGVDTAGVIQKKVVKKKWSTKRLEFHKTTLIFLYWNFGNVSGNRKTSF
jgi:hypothetical protein